MTAKEKCYYYIPTNNILTHNASQTASVTLTSTVLTTHSFSCSSHEKWKYNDRPLTNAFDVINRLAPVEYDQTQD